MNAVSKWALALTGALWLAAVCSPVVAETDEEEKSRLDKDAVARVVDSHDNTLIFKGGQLMIKQQAVRAAHKLLVRWGKEENLGNLWWEDRPEWKAAKADLVRAGDQVLTTQFMEETWLKQTWTEYTAKELNGEQADVVANHFQTEGGEKQRRLMDWYIGEMLLFYYTFTDRFDYEVKETQDELQALQKQALQRIPKEDLTFSSRNPEAFAFIACSPDSRYCPGLQYWKMLAIPLMGSVFRHMEDTTRAIEADMLARRPEMQKYIDEFKTATR
jgi:hypothetical protein